MVTSNQSDHYLNPGGGGTARRGCSLFAAAVFVLGLAVVSPVVMWLLSF